MIKEISITNGISTVLPLLSIVLSISMIKDAIEDYKR
jgi:hypothetical protein